MPKKIPCIPLSNNLSVNKIKLSMWVKVIILVSLLDQSLSREEHHQLGEPCIDFNDKTCSPAGSRSLLIRTRSDSTLVNGDKGQLGCARLFDIVEDISHWDCFAGCQPVQCSRCLLPLVIKRIQVKSEKEQANSDPLSHINHYTRLCANWAYYATSFLSSVAITLNGVATYRLISDPSKPLIWFSLSTIVPGILIIIVQSRYCSIFPVSVPSIHY